MTEYRHYRVVVLGAQNTGKSTMCYYLQNSRFNENLGSTIGATYLTKTLISETGEKYRCSFWDTAGSERFSIMLPQYVRKADAVLICYDIEDAYEIDKYYHLVRNYASDARIILVRTKIDIEGRFIPPEEKLNFANYINFLEQIDGKIKLSSKTGTGFDVLVKILCDSLSKIKNSQSEIPPVQLDKIDVKLSTKPRSVCCAL